MNINHINDVGTLQRIALQQQKEIELLLQRISFLTTQLAKAQGITVSHSGTAGTIPVAEHALMLMLSAARSLPRCHNTMANGEWVFPEMVNRVYELYEKTLGIVGLGKIGKQ